MRKTTIVINGPGGTGKDALIASISNYRVMNTSSIDPIKAIATTCGWNGEKDDAGEPGSGGTGTVHENLGRFPSGVRPVRPVGSLPGSDLCGESHHGPFLPQPG